MCLSSLQSHQHKKKTILIHSPKPETAICKPFLFLGGCACSWPTWNLFFFFLPRRTNSFNVLDDTTAITMYKSKKNFQTLILNVLKRIKFAKIQNSTTYVQKRAPFTKKSFNQIQTICRVQIPTLAVFALDHLTTYMMYFLCLAQVFKWGWRPRLHPLSYEAMTFAGSVLHEGNLMKLISDRLLR